ncbi:unnamed protein product [Symbiodinium sp. CCMP2592]|nr:unnamed protein product [Symbiodinium sp. CCMP2592]
MLACMRSVHWMIEQPWSSVFLKFPYLRFLEECYGAAIPMMTVRFWMGTYGHRAPKLTVLVGTPPWLPSMKQRLTKAKRRELRLSSKGLFKNGKQRGTGKKVVTLP